MTTTSVTTSTTTQFTVSAGNELLVASGGNVTSTTVLNGGSLVVSGGVETSAVISSGGTETVSSGSATGDQIFGSAVVSGGTVTNEFVESAGVLDLFGGAATGTVVSGGKLEISGGNTATNTTLISGGMIELATSGAVLAGTLTFSGGGNTLQYDKILSATKGDQAVITGFTATDKIVVLSGGTTPTTSVTSASGSNEVVATITSGGTTDSFTLSGSQYTTADVSWVSAGGGVFDLTTTVTSGVAGTTTSVTTSTASGAFTETSGNTLLVLSGGSVSAATIDNGAFLTVSGGADTSATISSGGTETVDTGSATGDQIFGTATTVSGGTGVFTNEIVENGGTFDLLNGNSAAGTTVLGGGLFFISGANAAVTGTVLSGGGTLELDSAKANISGSLTFAGGGNTLDIAAVASAGAGDLAVISGFSSTDKIDVTALGASPTLSFATSGGNEDVTVNAGANSETFIFSGTTTYNNSTLAVVSSGGHEFIEFSSSGFGNTTTSVTTSTTSGAFTETSGNTLLVLSGGSVSAATIDNGAFLTISGGADTSATISSGGTETVAVGSATGDQIFGAATIDAGATVTNEVVENNGTLIISGGTGSATTVSAGGNELVQAGSATGDEIFGAVTVNSGGTATSETVQNGGTLTLNGGSISSTIVLAGGTEMVSAGSATGDEIFGTISTLSGGVGVFTNEIVENGGVFDLFNGNSAAGTTVLSGGLLFVSGKNGPLIGTVLDGGGTVELDSPKATISGSLTFENGGNTLELADSSDAGDGVLATISGFSTTDKIDITSAAFPFSSLALSQAVSGGDTVADVTSGGTVVETFTFANPALAGELSLLSDGNGGADLEITPMNVTTSVTSATASGTFTEFATDTLLVLSGGSVSAATIDSGANLVVNGGVDIAAIILSGGVETVSAGIASGDQIFGSATASGGTVSNETVLSGGQFAVDGGLVSNIVLGGGGLLDLATPTATVTGSLTFENGLNTLEASAIASNGAGDQAVITGFSTADKIDVTGISPTGATLSFETNAAGDQVATISGVGGSESFVFDSPAAYNSNTMSLMKDGSGGVDLVLDTTPVVTFTSLSGLQTNQATYNVNGTVDTAVDPEAIGTTVSIMEGQTVVGTGTVGANGFWSANVTFSNDNGTNVLTASDTDGAGNTGVTSQPLTYNVNTTAAAFTPGNLVISISGDGDGSGSYGDNQASPITLEQITTSGAIVSQLVLPETTTVVNGVTENAISGEYGSSSEGTLELSADGHSLTIAGYGINAQTFNEGGAAVYGTAAEAQSTSVQGGQFTAVSRVIADVNTDGVVDTSTALFNVFNENNPRSVATVNGSSFFISGQGLKGDTTQGVFFATDGASSATTIDDATDTRTAEIFDGQLFVSADSTQGATDIADFGPLPTSATTPTVLTGLSNSFVLNGTNGNTINSADTVGTSVNLSPENFFFANPDTLYVADGGDPKNGGLGDGGLQKWVFNGTTWTLEYTLSEGLNLIPNTDSTSSGDTGLIGLTGQVEANGTVELYATTEPLNDLGATAVVAITDTLASTSGAGESFTTVLTASPDENIRGIAFAPTPFAPTISGTVANQTTTSEKPVTPFSGVTITDANSNAIDTLTITIGGSGGTLADGVGFNGLTATSTPGVYTLAATTATAVTSELDALVFTPTAGAPNTSSTSTLTLSDVSSANTTTPAVDSTTSVIDTDPAVAPTITGTHTTNTISEAPVQPFSGVTITDANNGGTDTDTLTITYAGAGTLSGTGLNGSVGDYTLSGTASTITNELDALSFKPVDGVANTSVTTTFTLSDVSSANTTTPAVDSTTSVIDTDPAVAPAITGTHTTNTISEAPVQPFSGVTITDANNGGTDTDTLTITYAGAGTLSGTGLNGSVGDYTLTGTASTITNELDALSFKPVDGVANTSVTTTFTLSDVSTAGTNASDSNSIVVDTDPAVGPTITGTHTTDTTSEAAVKPFSGVTITDANNGGTGTDTLTITYAGAGTLSGTGLNGTVGDYTLTGTAATITSELDALSFKPVDGVANTSVTTTFTLSDVSSANTTTPAVDSTTSVIDIDPAVGPTITGTHTTDTTSEAAVKPFSGVTITDANNGGTDTDTLTITYAGAGTLSGTGLNGSVGDYTLTGTAATITSELDALSFKPVDGVPNTSVTTTFTLSDVSTAGTSASDSNSIVVDTDPAVAPTITGTHTTDTTLEAAVKPFSGVTITDANNGGTDTDTLTITYAGAGTLSGTGLSGTAGDYTLTGTASTITNELDALSFKPVDGVPNTSVTTTFKLSDVSSAGTSASDSNTVVVDTDPAIATAPPTITSVTPPVVKSGQTTVIGTVKPGVAGATLSVHEASGAGTLSLVTVNGVQEIVYTAPANVTAGLLDTVSYTVTDQFGDQATGSSTVPVAPAADTIVVGTAGGLVSVGNGNTAIDGRAGNEIIVAGNGNDAVFAGTNEEIILGNGNNVVLGGSGDTILVGTGTDTISTGANSVVFVGNTAAADTITVGVDSVVWLASGPDTVTAGGGSTIIGGNGNSTVNVNGGSDASIALGNGVDSVTVTGATASQISVGNGNDTVTVSGGSGNIITAGNGNDVVNASGEANERIAVGSGNDTIFGGTANTIAMGNGNNTIFAGTGDTITLGSGTDTVAFGVSPSPTPIGNETVNSFNVHSDVIDFNHALFANFAAVMADAKQFGQNTVITADANDTVTLHGVALSSLTASNFHFS